MLKITTRIIFLGLLVVPVLLSYLSQKMQDTNIRFEKEEALAKYGFYFEEVSETIGVNFVHHSPKLDPKIDHILPQVASVGASVSVVDYDNDGWNDFYVTNSCFGFNNCLYHNNKDGSFTDVADKTGIAKLNYEGNGVSMGAVWGDYNNDGFDDVFVYKWGKPELFRNDSGSGFSNVTEGSGLPAWLNSNSAIWFDFDLDGRLDLFIGGYFREDVDLWHLKTTRILTESFEYSQNGGKSYLFKNNGDGTFKDITAKVGLNSNRWTFAAAATDVNGDGYPDLFIANDYGISELHFNQKGEKFVEMGKEILVGLTPKSGMNVSLGDIYNKGKQGFYVSNITEPGILLQGNNFWSPYPDRDKLMFINVAGEARIESGGWSYGAQFADFNNDGFQDLYVANGYISGEPGTSYWYDYTKVTGGNANIISDVKNWPAMKGRSQSGYQQNRIWLNDGTGHFSDVSNYVAEKEEFDSRSVAVADLWNRGVLDLIVANQNNRVMVYKNMLDGKNHWIAFEPVIEDGKKSAIGTIITIYWDSKIQSQTVTGGIGFSAQNQKRLHFGLGKSEKVEKAIITWPGGQSLVIENPEVDKLNLIEKKNE